MQRRHASQTLQNFSTLELSNFAFFVYGTSPFSPDYMVRDGATYRFIRDLQGSVRLVVNADTGAVVQRLDYDSFGNVSQDTNPGFQPFGFKSGLYDSDTGLVHFGARWYDPTTGRWISKDPILLEGGLNLYAFCGNDPVNFSDPSGLCEDIPWYENAWNEVNYSMEFWKDFSGGMSDFLQNYHDMRDANTIGADKYFHAKANYEAASRGPGGEYFAEHFSNAREIWDQNVRVGIGVVSGHRDKQAFRHSTKRTKGGELTHGGD